MFDTAKAKGAIGLGANMVGLLERIIIVDWLEGGESFAMVNPEIFQNLKKCKNLKNPHFHILQ